MIHTYWTGTQPTICTVEIVHGLIEIVEILVAQEVIIEDIPLAACVFERVSVTLAREIQPLKHKPMSAR